MEDISKINLNDVEYKVTDTEVKKRYPTLEELPTINGIQVVGNLSLANLGIQPKGEYAKYVDLPFKVSDLANDLQFQTPAQVQAMIQDELANFESTEYEIVSTVPTPTQAETGIIYLVQNASGGYDQYVKVGNQVVSLGNTTEVDLSNYYNKTETNTLLNAKANINDLPTRTQQLTNDSGFITERTTNLQYYTKTTEMNNLLNAKADKTSIPTKVSQLTNDKNYIDKSVADLTNYTKTTDINTALNLKADKSTTYTKTEVDTALNLKANKTEIPTKTSDITNDSGYITKAVNDLTNYTKTTDLNTALALKADKTEIPTKVSDLTNDSGFIDKNVNTLTNYYTKTQVNTFEGTALYNDVNGTLNNITLSDTVVNYEYLEFYFMNKDKDIHGSVKVYSPNGKTVGLNINKFADKGYIYNKVISINAKTVAVESTTKAIIEPELYAHGQIYITNNNEIYIYRVVGYKKMT